MKQIKNLILIFKMFFRIVNLNKLPNALAARHAKTKNKFVQCITSPLTFV